MEEKEGYIQIGVTAVRDPEGNFLPAVPVFIPLTPEVESTAERAVADVGQLFARKMKQYIDGGGQLPKRSRRE